MRRLTSRGCSRMSKPATVAVPSVGGRKQVSMRMVVVFPAPFGPRKPTICPFVTSKEMLSTAIVRAYLLVRPLTVIIDNSGLQRWFRAGSGLAPIQIILKYYDTTGDIHVDVSAP